MPQPLTPRKLTPRRKASIRELDENFALLIQDLSLLMRKHFNREVRDLGLTSPQWQVLAELYRKDGMTQTELADVLVMAKSPLGKLLDKLERNEWIERRGDEQDRRAKRIFLTNKLSGAIDPARKASQTLIDIATDGLGAAQRASLIEALQLAKSNVLEAVRAQYATATRRAGENQRNHD